MSSTKSNRLVGKYPLAIVLLFLCAIVPVLLTTSVSAENQAQNQASQHAATIITVEDSVRLSDVKRFGMNLGLHDRFGASQLLKNVIINPGFEAGEQAMIFFTKGDPQATRIQADYWDTAWNNDSLAIGQPSGHWNGATYEILSGVATGRSGPVNNFTLDDDKYTYWLDDGFTPGVGDAVMVRTELAGYYGDLDEYNSADISTTRPDSPGSQSLKLTATPNSWTPSWRYVMDSFHRDDDRSAGKLIIIEGDWRYEIWAKAQNAGDTLRLRFFREGESTFFDETIELSTEWQHIVREFNVPVGADSLDSTNPAVIQVAMQLDPSSGPIWVDDVSLAASSTNPTVFGDGIVSKLQELRPGILRNWGLQLGSSLDNQLAEPFARKTTASRPHDRVGKNFHYSLHEFLVLADYIDAEPWYVIPPTFTATELDNLVAYLSAPDGSHAYADIRATLGQTAPWTDRFATIHLEFGNELWGTGFAHNDPFVGATFRGGQRAAEVTNNRMASLRANAWFEAADFNLVIGGHHGWPGHNEIIEAHIDQHDSLGLAPYFGELDTWVNDEEIFAPLFASAIQEVAPHGKVGQTQTFLEAAQQGTQLAIYETNFHYAKGANNVPIATRNDFVSSQAGAVALPLYMLTMLHDVGIRNQAMWRATEFSFGIDPDGDGTKEYVRLAGGLRDIEATGRERPTWMGMELVNSVIGGDLLETTHSGWHPTRMQSAINGITEELEMPFLHSFAFRDGNRYGLVVFNLSLTDTYWPQIEFPHDTPSSVTFRTIAPEDIHVDNEDDVSVEVTTLTLNSFDVWNSITVPPHSIGVLEWTDGMVPNAVQTSSVSIASSSMSMILVGFAGLTFATFVLMSDRRFEG